jgi:hypothetical protein
MDKKNKVKKVSFTELYLVDKKTYTALKKKHHPKKEIVTIHLPPYTQSHPQFQTQYHHNPPHQIPQRNHIQRENLDDDEGINHHPTDHHANNENWADFIIPPNPNDGNLEDEEVYDIQQTPQHHADNENIDDITTVSSVLPEAQSVDAGNNVVLENDIQEENSIPVFPNIQPPQNIGNLNHRERIKKLREIQKNFDSWLKEKTREMVKKKQSHARSKKLNTLRQRSYKAAPPTSSGTNPNSIVTLNTSLHSNTLRPVVKGVAFTPMENESIQQITPSYTTTAIPLSHTPTHYVPSIVSSVSSNTIAPNRIVSKPLTSVSSVSSNTITSNRIVSQPLQRPKKRPAQTPMSTLDSTPPQFSISKKRNIQPPSNANVGSSSHPLQSANIRPNTSSHNTLVSATPGANSNQNILDTLYDDTGEPLSAASARTTNKRFFSHFQTPPEDYHKIPKKNKVIIVDNNERKKSKNTEFVDRILQSNINDPYDVFQFSKTARITYTGLRRKFNAFSKKLHPDKEPSPGAHEAFIIMRRAYTQLKKEIQMRDELEKEREKTQKKQSTSQTGFGIKKWMKLCK